MQRKMRVIGVLVVLSLLFIINQAAASCLLYDQDESLYCVDPATRGGNCGPDGCDQFTTPQNCDQVPDGKCNVIQCDVDCQDHTQGFCEKLGGSAVTDEAEQCGPACCQIERASSCSIVQSKFECGQKAISFGLQTNNIFFDTSIATEEACHQKCNAGSVDPGVRQEAGEATLIVTIQGDSSNGITVFARGPNVKSALTVSGVATLTELAPGSYQISASKIGYRSETETVRVTQDGPNTVTITLSPIEQHAITGTITYESIGGDSPVAAGAKVYLNGSFKGVTNGEGKYTIQSDALIPGDYSIKSSITVDGTTYSHETIFTIIENQNPDPQDLILTPEVPECGPDSLQKMVDTFTAHHVLGEKKVRLTWIKPCKEVTRYKITKDPLGPKTSVAAEHYEDAAVGTFIDEDVLWGTKYTYTIRAIYSNGVSEVESEAKPAEITLGNEKCEGKYHADTNWESFCIVGDQASSKFTFTCDNKNTLIPNACQADSERVNAETGQTARFFCAPSSARSATCKDAGPCALPRNNPFSLYYNQNTCLGINGQARREEIPNFCYYDYSPSIVDRCNTCETVQSCFAYKGKDACELNTCLTDECQWVNAAANQDERDRELIDYSSLFDGDIPTTTSQETGVGYCTPKDYKKEDHCADCSQGAPLFGDYYCTAQVCASLGRCLSNPPVDGPALTSCSACGEKSNLDINCYSYTSRLECTGSPESNSVGIMKNDQEQLTLSEDQCGWNRCKWTSNKDAGNFCVKDGDANDQGDCEHFEAGDHEACVADTDAPTSVGPDGLTIISTINPNITLQSIDQEATLDHISVCTQSAAAALATPCTEFIPIAFSTRLRDETIQVPILTKDETTGLLGDEKIAGENYNLIYFATDKFSNQEQPHSILLYVDNQEPLFDIEKEVTTVADTSSITLTLIPQVDNGKNKCGVDLLSIIPSGEKLHQDIAEDIEPKTTTFENLKGISYLANITCVDEFGNSGNKEKAIVTNPDQTITIVSPELDTTLSIPQLTFEISTTVGGFCKLYYDNTYASDFVTDEEGKRHVLENQVVPGIFENASVQIPYYSVICQEFLAQTEHAAAFSFTIDTLGPSTLIHLTEGARELEKGRSNWEEHFIRGATVDFECRSDGFPCASTQFCVGQDCKFAPFTAPFVVDKTNRICYFSNDTEQHAEGVKCGTINIDGFGITLEHPEPYTFQDQIWGISDSNTFEWKFYTKVPTTECKYDFVPNSNYDAIPRARTLYPTPEKRYIVGEFPTDAGVSPYGEDGGTKELYVKCINSEEEISPEQKFNLEFDPSAPTILSATANPTLLLEGTTVQLTVTTDDKTTCKFNDEASGEYDTMPHEFPGTTEHILNTTHIISYNANTFIGLTHNFEIQVQCKNGAGLLSETTIIPFQVDYSAIGAIESVSPDGGIFTVTELPLEVQTSKSAVCDYQENETYIGLAGAFSRSHAGSLSNLPEGDLRFPIRCQMGDHTAEALSAFTIDRTPPQVRDINDGNITCGRTPISILASTTDAQIVSYYYEVYDLGLQGLPTQTRRSDLNARSSGSQTPSPNSPTPTPDQATPAPVLTGGTLILNSTANPVMPLLIPTDMFNLTDNQSRKLYVKLKATDAAGLQGPFNTSDGVLVVGENFSVCKEDTSPPSIRLFIEDNESCSRVLASMTCQDTTGCFNLTYGQTDAEKSCIANQSYSGQKLSYSKKGFLCYNVEDNVGNIGKGVFSVPFLDTDGDGVMNRCDNCSTTGAGAIAGATGCAHNDPLPVDLIKDTDGDRLLDAFEKKYSSCGMDYLKVDTDKNNIKDSDEDPDKDGRTNLEEMLSESDPCTLDEPTKPWVPGGDTTNNETPNKKTNTSKKEITPIDESSGSSIPIITLISGLVLLLGGLSYLIYKYNNLGSKKSSSNGSTSSSANDNSNPLSSAVDSVTSTVKDAFGGFDKWKSSKAKDTSRKNVFDAFHSKSAEIPHVGPLISNKSNTPAALQEVAKKYVEHKDEIAPGLKREEKGIFAKLESIAKKTKDAPVETIVKKDEAKDIMGQLRDISKNRKKKP